jgi:hypothetical protein
MMLVLTSRYSEEIPHNQRDREIGVTHTRTNGHLYQGKGSM